MVLAEDVTYIIDELNKRGYEAFAVGGCVRDMLMGLSPKDWDITTSAIPETVKRIFKKTFDTGIKHGTVTVVINKNNYEVTTYRIDGVYNDGRRPSGIMFTDDLTKDLERRDFTVNAIAYHPNTGLIDPFGGADDIKRRLIRGVGCPDARFKEDALRMMRAVRFAAVSGFAIEHKTAAAIKTNAALIRKISAERIRDELLKTITAAYPEHLMLLHEKNILKYISAALDEYIARHSAAIVRMLSACRKDAVLCLSVFFRFAAQTFIHNTMKYLKFDNNTIAAVIMRASRIDTAVEDDFYAVRKTLASTGSDAFDDILYLKEIAGADNAPLISSLRIKKERVITDADCLSLSDLAVGGCDVIAHTGLSGKEIGAALEYLLDAVLLDPQKNKKSVLLDMLTQDINL